MVSDIFIIQNAEDFRKAIKSFIDGTNNVSQEATKNCVSTFLEQTGLIDEAVGILKDEVLCAICLDIPVKTCVTECRHIFCDDCIDKCPTSQCPMCRTNLAQPEYTDQKRLYRIDDIIDAVMTKHNPEYMSWKREEIRSRSWQVIHDHLRLLHDKILEFLAQFENENGIGRYRQKLVELAKELLSLKALPCFQADIEHFLIKEKELCKSASRIVRKVLQHLKCSIDEIESCNLLGYLSSSVDL